MTSFHVLIRPLMYFAVVGMLALQTGCARSGVVSNRTRDFGDIFTCCIGGGSGVKVRMGPVHIAAIDQQDIAGLRAGCGFTDGETLLRNEDTYGIFPNVAKPNWSDEAVRDVFQKGKGSVYDLRGRDTLVHAPMYQDRWHSAFGHEFFDPGPGYDAKQRGKEIAARSPFPFYTVLMEENPAYYTQFEISIGLGVTIRLGVNPGEFIDFLVGFASLDLYGDDL